MRVQHDPRPEVGVTQFRHRQRDVNGKRRRFAPVSLDGHEDLQDEWVVEVVFGNASRSQPLVIWVRVFGEVDVDGAAVVMRRIVVVEVRVKERTLKRPNLQGGNQRGGDGLPQHPLIVRPKTEASQGSG